VRSPGLHISDVYGALYKELDPKRYGGELTNPMFLALGTAWEERLEWLLIANGLTISRPEAFLTEEGIGFSPDLLINNGVLRVGEIKLTWMASTDDFTDPKFDKYRTQVMAYCKHLETPHARFYITHVNGGGGYGKPDPQMRIFDVTFTARELSDNWNLLLNYARRKKML
jgi:hypothetical protein